MDERKPTAGFLIAVGGLILVAYILSIGPACWFVERGLLPANAVGVVYEPCLWLEFQSPAAMQHAITSYTQLCHGESALTTMRDRPFWRSDAVGDLAFRLQGGQRTFYAPQQFVDKFWCDNDCETWEELGGPGKIRPNAGLQTLDVFQSRRIQFEVAERLAKMRAVKQSLSRGREMDYPSLCRAIFIADGNFPEDEIRRDVMAIRHTSYHSENLVSNERSYSSIDELIAFLGRQPRPKMRSGVLYENCGAAQKEVAARLEKLCRSSDLDLFIKTPCWSGFGSAPPEFIRWIVRASDSVYLDPE
jgi:hypothetical protein